MIALYGGSFDPVHLGHLRLSEDIREDFGFEKIIFIPAYISPLKKGSKASAEDRLNMLKLAISDNRYFDISDYEIRKQGKSYTIDTVNHFKKQLDHIPFFIIGTDAFLSLHKWKSPEELLSRTSFIVVGRGGTKEEDIKRYLNQYFPKAKLKKKIDRKNPGIYFYSPRQLDISSTEIRDRIKKGKSIKYLVPKEVEHYIYEKKLYQGDV